MANETDIGALRALLAKATPARWVADDEGAIEHEDGGMIGYAHPYANIRTVIARGEDHNHADAQLMAAARNVLPVLLDELERLRDRNVKLAADRDELLGKWAYIATAPKCDGECDHTICAAVRFARGVQVDFATRPDGGDHAR